MGRVVGCTPGKHTLGLRPCLQACGCRVLRGATPAFPGSALLPAVAANLLNALPACTPQAGMALSAVLQSDTGMACLLGAAWSRP